MTMILILLIVTPQVELMSVERFCPEAGAWEMVKEMRKKRWGGGGAVLHSRLLVVGGRGKRVGATGEVSI